jgi:hypothetical protein
MKFLIRPAVMTFGACALIFAATSCNPNRNNPNYNASRTQPGVAASPGASGGDTGSVSGAGDTSNTGSSSSSGSSGSSSGR